MWETESAWFDVAIVMSIFAIGNILFGHFEEHNPKWRRILKVVITLSVTVGLAQTVGRFWAYLVLSLPLLGAAYVHLRWLPQHGINGWTGEPKEKYYELLKVRK